MTDRKTIEENKLIADFKGWHHSKEEHIDKLEMEGLKYHTSWDWLMPACYKWDNLTDHEIKEGTWHEYENLCDVLDTKITLYEILPVWRQLVENIKWYNQQQEVQVSDTTDDDSSAKV